jgi:hypothetical protein
MRGRSFEKVDLSLALGKERPELFVAFLHVQVVGAQYLVEAITPCLSSKAEVPVG